MRATVRVLTWNLFHGRDGAPEVGATWGSVVLGRGEEAGGLLHLNRKWLPEMAAVVACVAPTLAALQEVPPLAVAEFARRIGAQAVATVARPLGSTALRGRLAAANPDLWRSREGTANVLLVAPPWQVVPGSRRSQRLNPLWLIGHTARRLSLDAAEVRRWIGEPRRVVAARVRAPDGRTLVAGCLHCQNARDPRLVEVEARRAAAVVLGMARPREPVVLAGDLNAREPRHPALDALRRLGLSEQAEALEVDHVFQRGLEVVTPPRRLPRSAREIEVPWGSGRRRVVLSDHDPVEAVYRLP